MKLIKKCLAVILTVVTCFACAVTFGCGNKKESGHLEGKFNLEVAVQNESGEIDMMNKWKSAYEAKHPEVNIIINNFGNDDIIGYMQKKAMNQDSLPHMVWLPDDYGHTFTDPTKGYFIDLRELYEKSADTDYSLYYDSMLHAASNSGEFRPTTSYSGSYAGTKSNDAKYGIYFAPRDYNQIAIVYNKKMFNDLKTFYSFDIADYYNPEDPDSWTMEKFAQLIQDLNDQIKSMGATYASYRAIRMNMSWEAVYTTFVEALGGDGLINDGNINLGSAKNKAVYDYLWSNFFNEVNKFDINDNFSKGTTYLTVVSRPLILSYLPYLRDQSSQKIMMDFIPFPAEKVAAGTSGYGITKKHANETQTANGVTKTNKEIAWDFIKFILSEEGQNLGGKEGFIQPVLKSLKDTGEWRQAFDPAMNHGAWFQGEELRLTTYNYFDASMRTALRTQMSNFFMNLTNVENGAPANRDKLISTYTANLEAVKRGEIL
ncbi:MAG: carbohydrate ABC transporter substrate-binding protein [Clostridia bacterium]|nr:carbohydrate ABC transporter substrate-binding protein [Clostridia bacterium]